jgi:hypothetical protein
MSSLQLVTTNIVRGTARSEVLQPGLTARLALDETTRNDAYAVRHASYLSGGYIDPQPDGLFCDADDLKPNNRCVVVYRYGKPVASVRLCTLDLDNGPGWDEIPASRIFPDAVAKLAADVGHDRPARLTEINRLVRHPDHANDFQLVFVLFRFVSFLVIESQSDMMLNCVRRNHTSFYRRMHFSYVDGPRRYAGVKFETNLMVCPEGSYEQLMADIPFVATTTSTKQAYAALLAGETVNVFAEG